MSTGQDKTYTTNLRLIKPGYSNPADIDDINTNMDTLDTNVNSLSQQIDGVEAAAAYVEDGNTASRTYTERQFVLWQGLLYTVKTGGMPQGVTISTTYLNPVTGGGLNVLSQQMVTKYSTIASATVGTDTTNLVSLEIDGTNGKYIVTFTTTNIRMFRWDSSVSNWELIWDK